MIVVVPEILSMLTGTSVPENDAPLWSADTAYAPGATVLRNHYVYRCLAASGATVTGVDPVTSYAGISAKWQLAGISNLYRCLDWYSQTQTTAPAGATEMTLVCPWPRGSTAFALLNMDGVSAHVRIARDATVYFEREYSLITANDGWWDYFFGETRLRRNIVVTSIIPAQATLTVTLRGPNPALGMLVAGRQYDFGRRADHPGYGKTLDGASVRTVDYSTQEMDNLGVVTHVPRFVTGRVSLDMVVHPRDVNNVNNLLLKVKKVPALWLGDNGLNSDPLNLFGFLKEVNNSYDSPSGNRYSLTVEGIA